MSAPRRALSILCALALAGCGADPSPSGPPTGWNVLWIVVDTLRADHLGPYGYAKPTSPALDALADRAIVFENAYSAAPWTKPSVASMLTSLYPPQHRVLYESTENQLASSLTTLPEVLKGHGYRTCAISENPYVQPETGFHQGFDLFERVPGFEDFKGQADAGAAKAIAWIGESSDTPFFLYLHVLDPHGPYTPAEEYAGPFLAGLPEETGRIAKGRVGRMLEGEKVVMDLNAQGLAYLEALYDAEIREVDAALGEVLAFLEAEGLTENTIVLFTSDHGEEFLDHGSLRHGYRLYEESVRVPLVLAVPGRAAQRVDRVVAHHVDLAPTVLETLGLPVPEEWRGRNLLRAMEDGAGEPGVFVSTDWRDLERRAVRRGEWKLIAHEDQDRRHLFHLGDDPDERHDRIGAHPDIAEALFEAYRAATGPIPGVTPHDATGDVNEELEEELRGLGYLDSD